MELAPLVPVQSLISPRMHTGRVIKSTGKWYQVLDDSGERWECRIRGKMRLKGLRTTNPIAVGDRVDFDAEDTEAGNQGVITRIHERANAIIRKSVNLSHEAHVVASNIDVAFLVVTLSKPRTSTGFIDRFLVTAEAYGVQSVLIFNKTDLYGEDERDFHDYLTAVYTDIGYDCLDTCAKDAVGVQEVYDRIAGKTAMFGGHSGVGKSTLINAMEPGLNIRTAEVSESHEKGKHTTTFAEMHPLENGGFIIDTPGIKGFGIVNIEPEELHHYFPEMFALLPECKFHNCRHMNEPGCAVHAALEKNYIAEHRYDSYVAMVQQDEGPYR